MCLQALGARSSVDRALASGARGRKFESCLQAVQFFGRVRQADNAKVISASITGTNATVTVKVGRLHAGSVTLSKTAAGWLINKLPGE